MTRSMLVGFINGGVIALAADYNVVRDWQAWALIVWFWIALAIMEDRREWLPAWTPAQRAVRRRLGV